MIRGRDNGKWINVEDELPPEDGTYEITNHPELEQDWCNRLCTSTAYYDGYGFMWAGVYRTPKFWRLYQPMEKKYGRLIPTNCVNGGRCREIGNNGVYCEECDGKWG